MYYKELIKEDCMSIKIEKDTKRKENSRNKSVQKYSTDL